MSAKINRTTRGAQYKTRKPTRRVPVTIKWLEGFGIERGDKAIVAMTGDVQVGELGYFSIIHHGQAYKQFRFVVEQDAYCHASQPSTYTPGGICLRERRGSLGKLTGCIGSHDGLAYGRVCAVERDGRPVETTLELRPYDEREGPATTRLDVDAEAEEFIEKQEQPAPQPQQAEGEASRAKLLKDLPTWGLNHVTRLWCSRPFGVLKHTREKLAAYNIRAGDVIHFTLDGDAEHGELALVTYYDLDDAKRYYYPAFLAVEGDHFCLRTESHLECDDNHHDAECLTIIGRVYYVERGGLPIRLKGLELRGLPYAEDLAPVKDEED